jgi:hypothetical protein
MVCETCGDYFAYRIKGNFSIALLQEMCYHYQEQDNTKIIMPRKKRVDNTQKELDELQLKENPTIIQEKIVEVIKEVIRTVEVEKPRLEGYELYAKLRDTGFWQGGVGATMENPSGIDKVYVPEVAELYQSFALDPEGWEKVRDALCRVWIEMHENAL